MLPGMELAACTDLAVPREVMQHVVYVESSSNPYAIGVVGGRLQRQPQNLAEALATVRMLEDKGYNFSIGIAQVNRYNLPKYGLASYSQAFDVCPNVRAGSRILAECYGRSGRDWGKAFSCYYSGNFTTGYRHGYVQKIYASMRKDGMLARNESDAIPVVARTGRKAVPVERYPLQSTLSRAEAVAAARLSPPANAPAAEPVSDGAQGQVPMTASVAPQPATVPPPAALGFAVPTGSGSTASPPVTAPASVRPSVDPSAVMSTGSRDEAFVF